VINSNLGPISYL